MIQDVDIYGVKRSTSAIIKLEQVAKLLKRNDNDSIEKNTF